MLLVEDGSAVHDPEPLTSLLSVDPDLGRLLTGDRVRAADEALGVRLTHLPRGPWVAERLAGAHPEHVALLVVDGVLAREVLIADTISAELIGPGDVVRPWRDGADPALLVHDVRWTVLADARLAVLDRRFASRLARFPEVNAMLIERLSDRAHRMAVSQAVSQLNGVDRRLLALFWHLGERWGRMTPQGVTVALALSHRMLAQLVGARRPTVSTALGELAERHELMRRDDGTWVLTGEPLGVPSPEVARIVRHRRRLLPPQRPVAQPREPVPVAADDARPRGKREDLVLAVERLRRGSALVEQRDASCARAPDAPRGATS